MPNGSSYIWRGQRSANWPLEPGLDRALRKTHPDKRSFLREQHLRSFQYSVRGRRGRNPSTPASEEEWWAIGQHNGLDTPFLDWSDSPFVAMFFAFSKEEEPSDKRRAVYALERSATEDASSSIKRSFNGLGRAPSVDIIRSMSDDNARLVSQAGLFTRAPDDMDLEAWVRTAFEDDDESPILIKFFMPNSERQQCLRSLNRMNINHASLFPDLYGASALCNMRLRIEEY